MRNLMAFLLIGSLFLPFSCYCEKDYFFYYQIVNRAELEVVQLNFKEALTIYQNAFKNFEKHRTSDLYNATLCAVLTGNLSYARNSINELITMGYTLKDFTCKTFKGLPDEFWKGVENQYDSLHSVYMNKIDNSYIAKLDTLEKQEQCLVHGKQSSYDSLVYEHAKTLYMLISEKGVPKIAMFEHHKLPIATIRHHFGVKNLIKYSKKIDKSREPYKSMDFAKYDLTSLLIKAVHNGDIDPNFVVICMEYNEMDKKKQLGSFNIDIDLGTKTIGLNYPKDIDIKAINVLRKSIGLESLQDAVKKSFKVKAYYCKEKFPFDEFLTKLKNTGISIKTFKDTTDFDIKAKFIDVSIEIEEEYLKNNILLEFKISQTGFTHSIKLPND